MNQFVDFMPAVYGLLYKPEEVAEHARIASRRGNRLVHAEVWNSAQGPRLCIVAEDRPGLLALLTDALLAQGMAIQSARAFCREVSRERIEAVDFLELRALSGSSQGPAQLDSDGLRAFTEFLTDLVASDMNQRLSTTPREDGPPTRVYFERQPSPDGRYLLVVDAPDSNGLLHAVCSVLHAKGMRIMACEIRTVEGSARDRFELEPSSERPLSDSELCDVQLAVLKALPAKR
jgi:UTP:GlnB (protein PII) uridylyltransferase